MKSSPITAAAVASLIYEPGALLQPSRRPPVVEPLAVVTADAPATDHAEAWLAINPERPSEGVMGVLAGSADRTAFYSTNDGGRSWSRARHNSAELFDGGDPHVAYGAGGRAYLSTITPFRVWRGSTSGGWAGPSMVPGRSYDRQFATVTRRGGREVVVTVGKTSIKVMGHVAQDILALSASSDTGASFEYPRLVLPDPSKEIVQAPTALIARDSLVLVMYNAHDYPVRDRNVLQSGVMLLISRDGARSFSPPVRVASFSTLSSNAGQERMLKSLATGGLILDGSPRSPRRGTLYASWLDQRPQGGRVMLAVSSDTGRTWSNPREVAPIDATTSQTNPGIAVSGDGTLAVLWNDRRADPQDRCFVATTALSPDGGRTFTAPVALSRTSVCPVPAGEAATYATFRGRFLQGGETQGLATVGDRSFLATWIDEINGRMQIRASVIRVPE